MFLGIVICDFLFDGDPEFILLMLYLIFSLVASFLKVTPYPAEYAPHLLDQVAREKLLMNNTNSTTTTAAAAIPPLVNKFCGSSMGETAANCGFAIAWQCYWSPERQKQTVGAHYKRQVHKYTRTIYFELLGRLVNWLDDFERFVARSRIRVASRIEEWSLSRKTTSSTTTSTSTTLSPNNEQDVVTNEAAEELVDEL